MSPVIRSHFYGDSHFCNHHFFREAMNEAIGCVKAWRFSPVDEPHIHAERGALMNMDLVENFSSVLAKEEPFPQVHVFQIGGNNLRDIVKGRSNESNEDVLKFFKELVARARGQPNIHLVFCSIIPSPRHEPASNKLFGDMNLSLKHLATTEPRMVSFLDLRLVAGAEHRAKRDLFARDLIHLSRPGALFIAKRIAQFLQHLPASNFGILSREEIFQIVNN